MQMGVSSEKAYNCAAAMGKSALSLTEQEKLNIQLSAVLRRAHCWMVPA